MPLKLPGELDHIEQLVSFFEVEILGAKTTWTDVSGLAIEVGVVDQAVSGPKGDTIIKKVMGTTTYGDITLKRNLSADKTFYTWAHQVAKGGMGFRKDGSIVVFMSDGTEAGRWTFTMAFPKKWSVSDLDVGSDDPMVEEVTLAIESLQRVK